MVWVRGEYVFYRCVCVRFLEYFDGCVKECGHSCDFVVLGKYVSVREVYRSEVW